MNDSLSLFHPLVARWFRERLGAPTAVQSESWPAIARGDHVLVTAPTGSGKTLTAFLWAIDRLVTEAWQRGRTRVLYVSPLKALNTDIRRNLLQPLAELEDVFSEAGIAFPDIRVMTRSGDTPQAERRQMLRRPPEILITTPESLNLLLSSRSGREILISLSTVILDEIHTIVDNKRGVHLITAVDRLVPLSGEFQRIAMSATIKPLAAVAEFVGGLKLEQAPGGPRLTPRPVTIVRTGESKKYDLRVVQTEDGSEKPYDDTFWPPLVREFRRIIDRNRSSLFFARSRRMCEHLTLRINAGEEHPVAYAHHGSLSKELRLEVEAKLKSGDLKAIVATNSLELGIDIGALDEVVLVQSPPSIASGVQRVGRAGHQVGAVSRGTFFPTHDQDFVQSAVIARAIEEGDIEEVRLVENPLDVLAQVLVSMAGTEVWKIDDLYNRIRTSRPYRDLRRDHFDLVLRMLAGRYAHTKVRELKPRISIDAIDDTATARKGALFDVFISGGTIPDRGYYHLRHEETGSMIGELDEEFVWEASLGQTFTFGTQPWTIRRITHNEVFVLPAKIKESQAPFWKGEVFNRNAHLSDKIAEFFEEADTRLQDPEWRAELETRYRLNPMAAERVTEYLGQQKKETGAPLPHLSHVLVEHVQSGPGGYPGAQLVLHTLWGGQLNRPFALALDAAWEERYGYRLEIFPGDDAIVVQLPHEASAGEIFSLVSEANLEPLLRRRLESSGYFGARFRENAGRALLLTRRRLNERTPLWMSRLRSQKLLQAVMRMPDFPILLETWRTCFRDEFDLEALKGKLAGLMSGATTVSECTTARPSPMVRDMAWKQVNQYMYAGDELPADRRSNLKSELLHELVFTPGLRPAVSTETVRRFEEKRHRLSPGYAPSPDRELVEWVKERVVIPWPEWERLMAAIKRDHSEPPAGEEPLDTDKPPEERRDAENAEGRPEPRVSAMTEDEVRNVDRKSGSGRAEITDDAAARIVCVERPGASHAFICALERLPEVRRGFEWGPESQALTLGGQTSALPRIGHGKSGEPPLGAGPALDEEHEAEFTELLAEWLQYYGPRTPGEIAGLLGIGLDRLNLGLEDLKDADALVEGALIKADDDRRICDAENFETLLRMERAAAAPRIESRPTEDLAVFLAGVQGLIPSAGTRAETEEEKVFRAAERLTGYAAPAPLWEAELFPARVPGYTVSMLDYALRQSGLRWQGDARRQVRFLFASDLDLIGVESTPPNSTGNDAKDLFPDPEARYDFASLLRRAGNNVGRLEERLWEAVWSGRVTNDTWSSLRRGLQTDFRVVDVIERQTRSLEYAPRRGGLHLSAWRESQAYPGSWFLVPSPPDAARDLVEQEERRKDRVRILLDRYGVLFRELLLREQTPFRWADVFRTLRIMELSGEVLTGYFFKGIPGPQFMSPQAFRLFSQDAPDDAVFWLSAVDPASVCGLPIEALRGIYPKRVEGTHVAFSGARVVLVSQRKGRMLTVNVPPGDERLSEYFGVLRHLLTRDFDPLPRVVIEKINGEPAPASSYLPALRRLFEVVRDRNQVSLFRTLEL